MNGPGNTDLAAGRRGSYERLRAAHRDPPGGLGRFDLTDGQSSRQRKIVRSPVRMTTTAPSPAETLVPDVKAALAGIAAATTSTSTSDTTTA
jgi:hypothetical protein